MVMMIMAVLGWLAFVFVVVLSGTDNTDVELKVCREELKAARERNVSLIDDRASLSKQNNKLIADYTALKATHRDLLESIHQAIRDATP